jgi:outer membrane PBP1 activator LpoA protein
MTDKGKERLREQAIKALLSSKSVEAAAKKIDVSAKTLSRWLRDEEFRKAYQAVKKDMLRAGIANLTRKVFDAVETLGEVSKHKGRPYQAARAHAASAIIRLAIDADLIEDLEVRIRKLEGLRDEI